MINKFLFLSLIAGFIFLQACNKATIVLPDNSFTLTSSFVKIKSGGLAAQASAKTAGTVELGTDGVGGVQVLHLGKDFNTDFGSGGVAIYLSKTQNFDATTSVLVSSTSRAGEVFFKVSPSVGDDYNYVIVYCVAAKEQFGYGALKTGLNFIKQKSGTFIAQAAPQVRGVAEFGTDGLSGGQWIHLSADFNSEFGTGAVTVFFSKTKDHDAAKDIKISLVDKPGEAFLKLPTAATSDFNFVIIYCDAAKVQFGYASIQ